MSAVAQPPRGVIVELRRVRGSAPREQGTRMMVTAHATDGTIGGGALEHAAIARARALLGEWIAHPDLAREMHELHALGPQLGQCCGGSVTLAYAPSDSGKLEAPPPMFHLQLHGAGHVGRAVVAVLATLGCTIDWIDSRLDAFPASLPGGKAQLACRRLADPVAAIADAPPGAAFLIMTHAHPLDAALCAAVMRRGDFGYLGLIGSETKRARFTRQWRRQDIPPAAIARLCCPIGIPAIQGKQPELIALAVAAELASRFPARHMRQLPRIPIDLDAECSACRASARCAGS
ncbi:xanthine dehydrogenase accessory protein XdhC [Acidiphilium sp.]|uniref:xanthine dehydrogenase accessory protein XdhC n=1 Tax=Acidiphilium sp. TaxID=527 RepID=UPI0025888789|nr:xanthine dehydrogenase accessory protein XdhC [Acidiphilium sp.]